MIDKSLITENDCFLFFDYLVYVITMFPQFYINQENCNEIWMSVESYIVV